MSNEARKRILQIGGREFSLKCPICGGEQFYRQEVRVDTSVFTTVFDKYVYYYACETCSHMVWMAEDVEKRGVDNLSPVEIWEQKFRTWGYAENEDTLRKVIADDGYHEDAHTAAQNLLKQLEEK